jgi:hypothetical protein
VHGFGYTSSLEQTKDFIYLCKIDVVVSRFDARHMALINSIRLGGFNHQVLYVLWYLVVDGIKL